MAGDRWATFDCYGTLIDWLGGIRATLGDLWPEHDAELLLGAYHEIEPEVQRGRAISYREVLTETLERLAHRERLDLAGDERAALADSLPSWPPFPEVPGSLKELRARGWRIAILSNTDPDLLEASLGLIGVDADVRITAAEAGSYKPAPGHWDRFFERTAADRAMHVHVGASVFHDIRPAAELGLTAVWINRLHESSDVPRAAELADLSDLPGTLDELVEV
ncbi:MAG: HAD family hydrolase [Actinomycetota bacterium]